MSKSHSWENFPIGPFSLSNYNFYVFKNKINKDKYISKFSQRKLKILVTLFGETTF